MTKEPEVLQMELNELKCPYASEDYRAIVWLEGYQAGYDAAANTAIKRLKTLAERT